MAAFPSLVPSVRTYTPGGVPRSLQATLAGGVTGFRGGNRRIQQTLSLSFEQRTEADITTIRTHYDNQYGSFDIFFLSTEIWSGYTTPPVPLLSEYAWRYTGAPVFTDGTCDRWNIEVELETVPIDIGDLVFNAGLAAASPAREYILDAGAASASPVRTYAILSPGAT